MLAVDDFVLTPTVINNVTGGDTPSILANDTQVSVANEHIVVVNTDGSGAVVAVNKKSLHIPRGTPIGVYAITYKIVNTLNAQESNVATVHVEVISRTSDYSREYPTNALDIIRAGNNGDYNRVFINPQQSTTGSGVYESLVLEGYTGTKDIEIMDLATAMKPLLDHAADKVEASIAANAPPATQGASRSYINGLQIDMVL